MRDGLLPVYPSLLAKALVATTSAALIGCAVAFRIQGELALRDVIGTAISSLLFAYLVHLWIALSRERLS